ncbi:hypothetical protein COO60DRAFT_1522059 [Scenedesmus sp. NREL 46B-D3]|nr:hypothetical protein COO60DRAFT_1522059 [Scenedesmus sp. NREL 46B-D3]
MLSQPRQSSSDEPAGAALPGGDLAAPRWAAPGSSSSAAADTASLSFAAHDGCSSSSSSSEHTPPRGVASGNRPSGVGQDEPVTTAAAAYTADYMREHCMDWLAEIACPGSSPEQLLASLKQYEGRATMHSFIAHDPAFTPMLRTSRGTFMPDKAVSDTGCIPSIMSEGQAKRLGYHIHRYKEGESAKVVNIEGCPAERFIGYTEPVKPW